jgi:hypothetical protein
MMPIGAGGQHGALVVQPAHQHAGAAVERAQHVLAGTSHVLEHQLAGWLPRMPSLSSFCALLKSPEALLDQEGRDAARARSGSVLA